MPEQPPALPAEAPLDFDALAEAADPPAATLRDVLPLALEESETFAVVDEDAAFGADSFIPDAVIEGMGGADDEAA